MTPELFPITNVLTVCNVQHIAVPPTKTLNIVLQMKNLEKQLLAVMVFPRLTQLKPPAKATLNILPLLQ